MAAMKPATHPSRSQFPLTSCIVALALALLLNMPPLVAHAQEPADSSGGLSPESQAIVQATNQRRAEAGLPPLTLNPLLTLAAQNHVNDMIDNGAYGHMGSDGSFVRQRVQRVGYSSGGLASENWVSATGPDDAMNWWMNDWIHRENILNPRWQEFGVGTRWSGSGRLIAVQVFTAGNGGGNGGGGEVIAAVAESEILAVPPAGLDYTIQPGDTLIGIAVRYGLDWTVIAQANRLSDSTLLQIGQVIRLPGVDSYVAEQAETAAAQEDDGFERDGEVDEAVAQAAAANAELLAVIPGVHTEVAAPTTPAETTYTVQPGDTLLSIAIKHGMTWETLGAANGLGEHDLLQIGQKLTIPNAAPAGFTQESAPPPAAPSEPVYYTIQPGDTILSVAMRNGMDWQALLALNGLTESSLLQIGQQIRLK
jgi:LysM repeat protein/uncharacterized protein YkwD